MASLAGDYSLRSKAAQADGHLFGARTTIRQFPGTTHHEAAAIVVRAADAP
jgi:hypothetical protein